MDEIIFRVFGGEATHFEEERLKKWRAENPENEARYQTMVRIWGLTEPGDIAGLHPSQVDHLAGSIISAAETRRKTAGQVLAGPPRRSGPRARVLSLLPWGAAIAASAAALALGFGSLGESGRDIPGAEPGLSFALSAQTLRLDDGSFVRLSPGSRLEAHLDRGQRSVTLDGRAFFAISPDPSRPFVVRTEKGQVRVLGTRFEVFQDEAQLRTVVLEGRVALSTPTGQVEVPGGSVGTAVVGAFPTSTPVEDVLSLLDWPGGLLVFHGTPLSDVAGEVARHFGKSLILEDSTNNDHRISASFEEGESFQEVVETLCSVTRSECRITTDSAVIVPPMGGQR